MWECSTVFRYFSVQERQLCLILPAPNLDFLHLRSCFEPREAFRWLRISGVLESPEQFCSGPSGDLAKESAFCNDPLDLFALSVGFLETGDILEQIPYFFLELNSEE